MSTFDRYDGSVAFLRNLDSDVGWASRSCRTVPARSQSGARTLRGVGPGHRLSATARAGDAIIARLRAVAPKATFPTPGHILSADFDTLRACGFSATKIATIKAIADGALSGLIPPREVASTMDDEELIARLVTIKGIGRWTVEMLLMYSLERPDVLPVDDFGVREGYRALKSLPEQPKPKELREISKAWAPHRTVASWYLWRMPRERGNVPA
jgi:DNA-3-methyladenine glycosylase II